MKRARLAHGQGAVAKHPGSQGTLTALADELHALMVQHLEHIGVSQQAVRALSDDLSSITASAEGSQLFEIMRYAKLGDLTVSVCGLSGRVCDLVTNAGMRVHELKTDIENHTGIPACQQHLVHEQAMDNHRRLADYGVSPFTSSITLVRQEPCKIYVVGGNLGADDCQDVGEIFDPETSSWTSLPPMSARRNEPVAAVANAKIYVCGGKDAGDTIDTAEVFDPETGIWTALPPMRARRFGHTAAVADGKIYVFGGNNEGDAAEVFDPEKGAWSMLPPISARRVDHAVAFPDGKIHVLGESDLGHNEHEARIFASVEVFDPKTGAWSTPAPMSRRRVDHAVAVADGKIYVLGGNYVGDHWREAENSASVEVFNPKTGAWSTLAPMSKRRVDHAAAAMDGKIYVLGGYDYGDDGHGAISASAEVFDLETGAWSSLPPMSFERERPAASIFDGKVYVFGGMCEDVLASAEVFDPCAGCWSVLPPLATPRCGCSAFALR